MASQEGINQDQTVTSGTDEKLATHSIADTLSTLKECSVFLDLAGRADADRVLRLEGLRTLFVPRNEAATHSSAKGDALLNAHVIPGGVETFDMRHMATVKTMDGTTLPVHWEDGNVRVGNATIVRADIPCTNGVIHVIDSVLKP